MNRCETCKHFEKFDDQEAGTCWSPMIRLGSGIFHEDLEPGEVAIESVYSDAFTVTPKFGCINWEAPCDDTP